MVNEKKVFIETFGCAMNHKDSENLFAQLKHENYSQTTNPENADLIIINTCSVREKPVHKLFSELGHFNKIKKESATIGVAGCTASHMGREIINKAPYVHFVIGARNVSKIRDVIHKKGAVEIDINHDDSLYQFSGGGVSKFKKMVNISIGCDKKCTFCIVPHTRGTEISIPTNLILDEIKKGDQEGAKEFILLGQNVNNYGRRFSNHHKKTDFTQLLKEVTEIDGVERVRFTSPHPLHMDNDFIEEFASNPKIAKSIHVPLQSGSTKILKEMKRGYSKEWFLDRVNRIRNSVPNVSISTDIIVAFPNESEEDFLETMEVLELARFEQMFSFKYSPRPLTEASKMENSISDEVASERLKRLQSRHLQIMDEIAQTRLGQVVDVLLEEDRGGGCLVGRSSGNLLIKTKGDSSLLGKMVKVEITHSHRTEARGRIV